MRLIMSRRSKRRAGLRFGHFASACVVAVAMAYCTAAVAQPFEIAPRAHTAQGDVIGRYDGLIASFLGIPYAAPPVGNLRFAPPQPHAAWTAPLPATQYGSPCPQTDRLHSASSDEDCLFLNVYAPAIGVRNRPVMVFFHGGSFISGNGGVTPGGPGYSGADYSGVDIANRSGVVVVTLNYRLSLLGFLATAGLDADNGRPSGNYGLQDQQQALRWVRQNIAGFGGDPNNVTIFGQSAGGISVLYQVVSPDAAGLFSRAIIESSDDGNSVTLPVVEALYNPVIEALGCDPANNTAACLRAVPTANFLALEAAGVNGGPFLDGRTVPAAPAALIGAGQFNRVPIIAGTTANEGSYFIAVATNAANPNVPLTAGQVTATIAADFPAGATQILAAYPFSNYATPGDALAAIATDSFFACPTDHIRTVAAAYTPVWGYEFDKPNPVLNFPVPSAPGVTQGDSHTAELAYVFGHNGAGRALSGGDALLSRQIIDYWTSLAASGNVNNRDDLLGPIGVPLQAPEDRPFWPSYAPASRLLSLTSPPAPESNFAAKHQCALWASLGYPEVLIESVATP